LYKGVTNTLTAIAIYKVLSICRINYPSIRFIHFCKKKKLALSASSLKEDIGDRVNSRVLAQSCDLCVDLFARHTQLQDGFSAILKLHRGDVVVAEARR